MSLALLLMLAVLALQQYWVGSGSWQYVPVASFSEAFKKHKTGVRSAEGLSVPFDKTASSKDALVNQRFSLSSRQLQRAIDVFQEHLCLRVCFLLEELLQGCLRCPDLSPSPWRCVAVPLMILLASHQTGMSNLLLDQEKKLLDRFEAHHH